MRSFSSEIPARFPNDVGVLRSSSFPVGLDESKIIAMSGWLFLSFLTEMEIPEEVN